ncbi:MAG: mobile mystery protein B [Pseudomonadota bacterium]
MIGDHAPGATPIDADEKAALIPQHLVDQSQLNEWEEANIQKAVSWLEGPGRRRDALTEEFVRALHRRMFDKTWCWAGTFRSTGKNIGVDAAQIPVALRNLLEDMRYRLEHGTHSLDESAARFHHRLVAIHPFVNGNGRHARLMTDVLLQRNGTRPFTWGRGNLLTQGAARDHYLAALHAADTGAYALLLAFVRS